MSRHKKRSIKFSSPAFNVENFPSMTWHIIDADASPETISRYTGAEKNIILNSNNLLVYED
jgi:hypothetical protein